MTLRKFLIGIFAVFVCIPALAEPYKYYVYEGGGAGFEKV